MIRPLSHHLHAWFDADNSDSNTILHDQPRLGLFKGDFLNQIKGQINYFGSNLYQIKGQIKYLGSSLMFYQIKGFIKYLGSNLNQIKVKVKCWGLHFYQIKV